MIKRATKTQGGARSAALAALTTAMVSFRDTPILGDGLRSRSVRESDDGRPVCDPREFQENRHAPLDARDPGCPSRSAAMAIGESDHAGTATEGQESLDVIEEPTCEPM